MATHLPRTLLIPLMAVFLWQSPERLAGGGRAASRVEALFDLSVTSGGPFPSDRFTVRDDTQNTGLRVNLPKPACTTVDFNCDEIDLLNELDGFHIQPRLSIPFTGPIDPNSVSSKTVFLVPLGSGRIVGINEVVWDVATNSLHATADEILEQHSRYALIVTRSVRDASGNSVEPAEAFERFRHDLNFGQSRDAALKSYRKSLLDALARAVDAGIDARDIVAASVFTTQSVTAVLEKIGDQIKMSIPQPANFHVGSSGSRAIFRVADIAGITVNYHVADDPTGFTAFQPRLPQLRIIPGAVETLALGKYVSRVYAHNGGVLPVIGTRTGIPNVLGTNDVYFTVFLPSQTSSRRRPGGGWPVVIFGPGQPEDDIWGTPFNIAASLAEHGLATVSIQSAWHGFGPLGTATVSLQSGETVTLPAGGRNSDNNGDDRIEAVEGIMRFGPAAVLGSRNAWTQTVADTMQFVRVLEAGVDVDGDGLVDLDPARIYYVGFSGGGSRGIPFVAVEPAVRAAVFNAAGGARAGRLSPGGNRGFLGQLLAARVPSLINPDGAPLVRSLGGINIQPPFFNENLPLRNEPAVINTVAGAIDIQQWLDRRGWLNASADPVAFAPYLRKSPLQGLVARPVIVTFVRGDQTSPNPGTTALLRAGELADRATFFRNDLAFACNPAALERNAHAFFLRMNLAPRTTIALAVQKQAAEFLASDGTVVIDPDDVLARVEPPVCGLPFLFEVPIVELPEDLGFIR